MRPIAEYGARCEGIELELPAAIGKPRAATTDAVYGDFIASCCEALGVGMVELLAIGRDCRQVVEARRFIAWALRDRWRLSYPQLAKALHRKDHTTMISSVRRFQRAVDNREFWALQLIETCAFNARSTLQVETALETLIGMGEAR